MKITIKSVLEPIIIQTFVMGSLVEIQQFTIAEIEKTHIKQQDKEQLINQIKQHKNPTRLKCYLCNALLKYEGMSLTPPKK
jgi:hypothetical protein